VNMKKSILIAGATGLVGSSLVNLIKEDPSFSEVIILVRKDVPSLRKYKSIRQHIIDFTDAAFYKEHVKADTVVCALGTTIKKAGSQEKFREVDYLYPLQLAEAASANKCDKYILVSAVGADPSSKVFYNRVKGELERDLQKLKFKSLHFLNPSLLLGKRDEKRAGEGIGKALMPLFSFILPDKYKPIKAEVVAAKIKRISEDGDTGVFKYEGKEFYE
jgi:uncharacterized protein YbjT (DUF2867 family)